MTARKMPEPEKWSTSRFVPGYSNHHDHMWFEMAPSLCLYSAILCNFSSKFLVLFPYIDFTYHSDVVVTVAAHAPPPSLTTSPHPMPPFKQTQHYHVVSHTPTPILSKLNQSQRMRAMRRAYLGRS